jgi:glycosyltransferase involved in cell wall biosynthesis
MAKIVHFGKYYLPDTGGVESVTLSLANGAAIAGHDVSVICFGKNSDSSKEIINGVLILREPIAKLFNSQPLGFKYFLKCLTAFKNTNVVHMHAPNMLGALCALFTPARTKLLVHWHSDVINKGLLGSMLRPLESALLCRANCIISTSQVYADTSKTLANFKDKVTVVPIGVPDVKPKGIEIKLPPSLESQIAGRKIILSVGRLVSYKGFNFLIQSAQKIVKDSVIVIVGSGPMKQELQNAIVYGRVEDRVVLAGRQSGEILQALFERAALFCLPSTNRAESFGVVLIEAMAYGLPIVASNISGSGVPWVNQHGVSGLNVPVGDAAALADACNQILDRQELRICLSQGARKRYISEFTEEAANKRMKRIYELLLEG